MELQIKKALYCVVVIITAIVLSTLKVHAATYASAIRWSDSGSSFTRNLTTYTFTGIKLPRESADTSSDIHMLTMPFLHQPGPYSLPLIISASPDRNNISDNISRGEVASVPEPLTLLLLGTGLMGIALYRRLINK